MALISKFKKGDTVYLYKPISSWRDTERGITGGFLKLNTPYKILSITYDHEYGHSVTLKIGHREVDAWSLGIDCLKLWSKLNSKPTWL